MFDEVLEWLQNWRQNHLLQGLALTLLGVILGWMFAWWRRHRMLRQIEAGSAREMVAIEQILIKDYPDGRTTMRIRACAAGPLRSVLVNPVAHDAFLARAEATTPTNTLISMQDRMGSYLLYLLTPWVCGMTRQGRFPHALWVMAPVCEPGLLSAHQSTTIVLIRREDLLRFLDWDNCKRFEVEHGSDGARVLTLWQMAREFEKQVAEVNRLKEAGKPSTTVETMYLLDLGLDTDEVAIPTKPVPWERFAPVLKKVGLSGR
jgi:hypothetical protein